MAHGNRRCGERSDPTEIVVTRLDDNSVQIQWTYGGEFEVETEVHGEGRYGSLLDVWRLPRSASPHQYTPDPVARGWFYFRFREKRTCEEKGRIVSDYGPWLGHAKAFLRGRAVFTRPPDPVGRWVGLLSGTAAPPEDLAPALGGCPLFCPGDPYSGQCHAGDYRYYTLDAGSRGNRSIWISPEVDDGKPIDSPVHVCGHHGEGDPIQCEWTVVPMRATCP